MDAGELELLIDIEVFLEDVCDAPFAPIDMREARRMLDAIRLWRSGRSPSA